MDYCKLHKCPLTEELCNECKPHLLNEEPDMIDNQGNCKYYADETLKRALEQEVKEFESD